ncbi:MAG: PLP-dependent aspartate aminotransferase family protein [Propionibacteriaceae bacterium]|nr:PLP-dependent aspartate aminotransferase family protein [Propionibacteriaceae bacterium]
MNQLDPTTRVIRAGIGQETYGDVVAPLHLSTNFVSAKFGETPVFDYSRSANPTRALLGRAIADLEGGCDAVVTASGMAAITTVLEAFTPAGGTVIAPLDGYGGTWRLLDAQQRKGLLKLSLVDTSDLAAVAQACDDTVKLVIVETPSNPLLRVTDIAAVAELARARGAIVVADNTFATPMLQRPLELGADIVVHSATKYLAGHSDVVLGAVVAKSQEHFEQIAWWSNALGLTAGAIDSYLGLRGLRTLRLRMQAAQANAAEIAHLLDAHPAVSRVYYPGLPSHPGHELARRQQDGFGAIVSFEVADAAALAGRLRLFTLAESLGGVESLISHPATMTHASMPPDVQAAAGITPGLLRLSVGVEPIADLVADLTQALDEIA